MMLRIHPTKTYMLCYYDARITPSLYGGFFMPFVGTPTPTYYAFAAYGKLYALGSQAALTAECDEDSTGFYSLAAVGENARAVYLVNFSEQSRRITTNLDDTFKVYLIDDNHKIEISDLNAADFTLEANQIAYIEG